MLRRRRSRAGPGYNDPASKDDVVTGVMFVPVIAKSKYLARRTR